jgi:hypothetical protein
MWISTIATNIYLVNIRFEMFQYLCNTLYKSHRIPTVLGILPYIQVVIGFDALLTPYFSPRVSFQGNGRMCGNQLRHYL